MKEPQAKTERKRDECSCCRALVAAEQVESRFSWGVDAGEEGQWLWIIGQMKTDGLAEKVM